MAIGEVLGEPAKVISLRVTPDGLVPEDEIVYAVDTRVQDRVFFGWDEAGHAIGFALVAAEFGYGSDPIKLIFGYDAHTHEILGMKVLEDKETPGIGTGVESDASFAGLFWKDGASGRPARQTPLVGRRDDQFDAAQPHEIDMISGATISSRAVIKSVNGVTSKLQDRLEAWNPGEVQ
jgi:electron transport complex protein RnfG